MMCGMKEEKIKGKIFFEGKEGNEKTYIYKKKKRHKQGNRKKQNKESIEREGKKIYR